MLQVYAYAFGTPIIRGLAYFLSWILAYHITGAEFNPATSIARWIAKKEYGKTKALGFIMLSQIFGALGGIFFAWILLKYNGVIALKPKDLDPMYMNLLEIYWGRLIMHEALQTFFFTIVYLVLRYESAMKQVDRIIRGAAASITLIACLSMTANSGGSLNPALGIAQSIYMIGVEN